MSITLDGTTGITTPTTSTTGEFVTSVTAFKNRIINGAMMISQRGTSFTSPAVNAYTLDRWIDGWAGAAPASIAQVAGIGSFSKALQITGSASNTAVYISQRIESNNTYDLVGQNISIQATIEVSTSQTVKWELYYPNSQDNYSSATLITSGTWSATSTATTFTASISNLPSSVANGLWLVFYPNNNTAFTSGTFKITGVQLEKGSTATSFDYRPYGTELALCQRYYQQEGNGTSTLIYAFPSNASSNFRILQLNLTVSMRTSPTISYTNATGSFSTFNQDNNYFNALSNAGNTTSDNNIYKYTANAEL